MRLLERYELLERLGAGGMAEVFRAKAFGAHGFEKVVAIKRILPALANAPNFEKRFITEARVAVTLTYSNIVQVLDFGRCDNSLFLVMEYVDGVDLERLLQRHRAEGRPLQLEAALHIGIEFAKGLDFAHRHNVVHRDISPSNVLLSRAGEVKLADFGIAVPDDPARQAQGEICGKWAYMSPEQTLGRPLDARSDIFSAGVLLYEIMTGQPLFHGAAMEIVGQIHSQPLPAPSTLRRELPPALDAVVARALAYEPGARHATTSDLLRALVEAAYGARLVTTPAALAQLVHPLCPAGDTDHRVWSQLDGAAPSRRRVTVADEAVAVTIVRGGEDSTGLTLFSATRGATTQLTPAGELAPMPRRRQPWLSASVATALVALFAGAWLIGAHHRRVVPRLDRRAQPVAPPPAVQPAAPAPAAPAPIAPSPSPLRPEVAAKPPVVRRELRYGKIDLFVQPWANVYFHERKIADAPVQGLRLPLGHHRLTLVNPVQHRQLIVEIDVPSAHPYRFSLP
jgi:serine/threonine-protein kinase